MKRNKFPPGWDANRVKRVLAHYEEQSEQVAFAEDEVAFEAKKSDCDGSSNRSGPGDSGSYRKA